MPSKKLAYLAEKYFDNRCRVTLAKFKPTGFVIHHIGYTDNDVRRKDYPKGTKGTESYYHDLEIEIIKRPEDFVLIRNGIHTKLDHYKNGVVRLTMQNMIRFFEVAMQTKLNQITRGIK